jgi:hypothetical protein
MRIRSSLFAVLSSVVLFACGGANQEAKSANEKDPWADYKGTYATSATPRPEGATKSKSDSAKSDSKAKAEKTEEKTDDAPAPSKKSASSSSSSPSKGRIGGESISSVTSESVADAVKGATKGKVASSAIVIGPQYEQISVKTKSGVAVQVFRKASSPDENGPAVASPKAKSGEVSKNDASWYDEDADVLVVVTGAGKKGASQKVLGSILKK